MRAVQFDLDDTLFDHKNCSRAGLLAVHRAFAERIDGSFNEFEATYRELLEQLHVKVLVGSMAISRTLRSFGLANRFFRGSF